MNVGFDFRQRQEIYFFSKMPGRGLGPTQPLGFSQMVKWLGLEVNHSPPSTAEFKSEWSCTSAPCIWLCGIDRDNFTVYLNLYRTNVTASVMQPCTRCWPNVAATVTQCMHEFIQISPCLLETETQTNSTVVPTTGLAFVRSHYVIFGCLGFNIIYGRTWPLGSAEGVTDTIH